MQSTRSEIAQYIHSKILAKKSGYQSYFNACKSIQYFSVDNLLPTELANAIYRNFPSTQNMLLRKDLREHKYMSAQMNRFHPLLEEVVYAFHDLSVVHLISSITGLKPLITDADLYVGGITILPPGGFMNPHIDNSHDRYRQNFRVLNLLYYVSPDWNELCGGNLELWLNGRQGLPTLVPSLFNRLLVIATDPFTLHSVNPVRVNRQRCCVVNYYFSSNPPRRMQGKQFYISTSFRGRPDQPLRDVVLRMDGLLRTKGRMLLNPLFRRGILKNQHFYDKSPSSSLSRKY